MTTEATINAEPGHQLEHLEEIGREECLRLLKAHGVGRVGASVQCRPIIYPVNYTLADDSILFLTRPGGDLDRASEGTIVAFEIDSADFKYHEGWSVLVVGRSAHVSDPSALERARGLSLMPWAGDQRTCMVRIVLDHVSGQRSSQRAPKEAVGNSIE
jgi:nitroimidazol reductase NimA-like FMN-containing flavoprotein (pyridoxamine 5'-phosphate oxidase superfamily)